MINDHNVISKSLSVR